MDPKSKKMCSLFGSKMLSFYTHFSFSRSIILNNGFKAVQNVVTVVGYPTGGDTISMNSGVVSDIELLSYVHRSMVLGLPIDAAINTGNS
ncbi:hypothetical protein RND81_05G143700 [Saponaria officinalis]|uniref:Uncharacterized protein n=1 Tax=Saponaria officinalis TaxID=3572 RepID=A0AAW1KY71_SAPOF